ncbi:MAG: T9SS type A sorting domain-containing protein [Bacteroidota bacterium]
MKKIFFATVVITSVILLLSFVSGENPTPYHHTQEELAYFSSQRVQTPLVPGEWYLTSASCRGCHGIDSMGQSNIDEDGNDVNLVSHWESTMMALSAKDPLWKAKVSQEILTNPGHAGPLQDKCTSCHAPTGRYNHFFRGMGDYTLAHLANDSLGQDGVNCAGCHTISPSVGSTFSGNIPYDTTRTIYGPFQGPMFGPMQLYEGYTPVYSAHMDESRLCSSCHTLITETADLSGNPTGQQFIEQATYHEYLNSSFQANSIKCQTCHMPQLASPVVIANGFIALTPRSPFNQHVFAGANYFMIDLIKNNKTSLGISVDDARFDTTLAATANNLRLNSINLNLMFDSAQSDTGYFRVSIENKVGHKFPSGYPSRRAVLQFIVTDVAGDTIFKSGLFDEDYRVIGETPAFEPHHAVINQSNVPQIYEIVMGDVNGDFTSILERAALLLKDNRIPPNGFTSTHSAYDTCIISPDAMADPDFNKNNSIEGSATDYVHFHVPLGSFSGDLKVTTRVFYQAVPPKWLDEMFVLNSPEIDSFRTMYANADKTPFLVATDSLNLTITDIKQHNLGSSIVIYPSVSRSGEYTLTSTSGVKIEKIEIFDATGKIVSTQMVNEDSVKANFIISGKSGNYYIRIVTSKGVTVKKVLKL